MTCPNCGWYVRGGARFCPNCGAEMPSAEPSRTCPRCGAKLEGDVSLCPNCGAAVGGRVGEAAAGEPVGAAAPPPAPEAPAPAAEAAPEPKRKQSGVRVCPSCKTELKGKVGICPVCGEWLAGEPAPRPASVGSKLKPLSPQWPFDAPSPAEKERAKKEEAARRAEAKAKAAAPAEAKPKAPAAGAPVERGAREAAAAPGKGERGARSAVAAARERPAAPAPERPAEAKPATPPQPAPERPLESRPSGFRVGPPTDQAPEPRPWYVLHPAKEEEAPRSTFEPRRARVTRPETLSGVAERSPLVKSILELLPWLGLLLGIVLLSVLLYGLVTGGLSLPHLSLATGRATATLAATSTAPAATLVAEAADVTPTPAASPTGEPTRTPSPSPTPLVHVVLAGESLGAIAQKYGVTLADLMAANGIEDANKVSAGQELKIPGAGSATPAPSPALATTATATPAASPTASPVPSITPSAFEFPAPNLLTPADGQVFQGADDILLNWSSVGLLGDDTWYVVKIWSEDPSQPTPATGWTRTTAWRIPASSRPAANASSRKMFWMVTVMRAREGQEPVAVSPASATRSFVWQ